jgi:hypothetical protein
VLPQIEGRKQYIHPVAGLIVAEQLTFSMTDNPELRIAVFSPIDDKSIVRMRAAIAVHRNSSEARSQRKKWNSFSRPFHHRAPAQVLALYVIPSAGCRSRGINAKRFVPPFAMLFLDVALEFALPATHAEIEKHPD